MGNQFFKHLSFDTERVSDYNGSVQFMITNIPEDCKKLHIDLIVSSLENNQNGSLEKEDTETIPPLEEPVRAAETPVSQPETEHKNYHNKLYRQYVQAVRRARGR